MAVREVPQQRPSRDHGSKSESGSDADVGACCVFLTKADLSLALREKKHVKLELRGAVRRASIASREAASDHSSLLTLRHQALTVSSDAVALETYVTTTQALDSGFLRAQLTYLVAAARRLQTP